jgi:tungstate transport system ATP-binding protein
MILYTLHQVTQRYSDRTVLEIDHLEIEAGGIYALLGPNGAGKTTLLNILAFLESPTTGTMTFAGTAVEPSRAAMLNLRRQVVLVDQHPIMFSTSVCQNIEFGLKIRKIEKNLQQRMIDEALETVGLRAFKGAAAHELSGGETQRLALARALALSPRVLLCDEPTASVDVENQGIIGTLLQQINATKGTTIIFTTHDRLQAAALAQQTLVLENGRLAPTTYENSYSCTVTPRNNGLLSCTLQGRVEIPLAMQPPKFQPPEYNGRVYIDPEKIRLFRPDNQRTSAQEVSGTVMLIMAEGEKIRVVVNIGVLMVVLMEQALYQQQLPAVSETVTLRFASDAVSLLDTPR